MDEALIEETRKLIAGGDTQKGEDLFWEALRTHENEVFETAMGLSFTYQMKGYELFISRKSKSITRSSCDLAYRALIDLRRQGLPVRGPKKLKVFGASYLYPVMMAMGLIERSEMSRKRVK